MSVYSLSHLGNGELLRGLTALVSQDRTTTAALLAHLAEVEDRKLFLEAAHPSMYSYCVHELAMSEDEAYRRIHAARAGREFPVLFEALADGRLHLSAVALLRPYLTRANVGELVAVAAHQTKAEIQALLARRFPGFEMLPLGEALPGQALGASPATNELGPDRVGECSPARGVVTEQLGPDRVGEPSPARGVVTAQLGPDRVPASVPRTTMAPLAAGRFQWHVTVGQGTQDLLCTAQELLGHRIPSGDIGQVLHLALQELVSQLEKRKFAATEKPRAPKRRSSANPRHVPAAVKRAVDERNGGRCRFTDAQGRRCTGRARLEFHHGLPWAVGGDHAPGAMSLLCRTHNRHLAEVDFGPKVVGTHRRTSMGTAVGQMTLETG